MRDIPLTVIGNLTDDPELRFTTSGVAVAKFTVAQTPQRFDKVAGQWVDTETTFMVVTVWRQLAEHVSECLKRGQRVIAVGNLVTEVWENDQGEKRSRMAMQAQAVGPELTWHTADVRKAARRQDGPRDDEWSTGSKERPSAPAEGAQGSLDDEPPF